MPTAGGLACSSVGFHCKISRVPAHEFFFALECSSQGPPALLLEDLASQIFRHVGCGGHAVAGLTEAFVDVSARTAAGGHRRCDVQFRAHSGRLDILVSSNGGRVWQDSVAIP
jgi:hypothetical protein